MKSYKNLFRNGFVFNGKEYDSNTHITNYFNLIKDILDGVHGELPKSKELSLMFKSAIRLEYDDLPPSVKRTKQYRELGDIYVITHKGSDKMKSEIKQFAKFMKKEVVIG
jgi:hypothetical protein